MISLFRTLYNLGNNDGDMLIISKDKKQLNCHTYVINYASQALKKQYTLQPKFMTINYNKNIIDIIFNYIYSERILEYKLSLEEILDLFSLINDLRLNINITKLNNYYAKYYSKLIDKDNWIRALLNVYNIPKYADLHDHAIKYIKDKILSKNALSINDISDLDNELAKFVIKTLSKIIQEKDKVIKEHNKKIKKSNRKKK